MDGVDRRLEDLRCRRSALGNVRARVNLGIALAQSGQYEAAELQLREASKLDPNDSEALYNLGLLLASSERFDEAERLLTDAARVSPQDPSIAQLLDRVRRQLEKGQ